MFPSKTPVIFVLHMMIVMIVTIAVLAWTMNPLAILGLMFMPSIPMTLPAPERESAIGFTADVDQ